jgi:hydroxymethylbilane synthase
MEAIQRLSPALKPVLKTIKTSGDSPQSRFGPGQGDKGLFVKEIEEALLAGEIDLAVHSAKDLPTNLAQGLTLGPVPPRAPAGDLLFSLAGWTLQSLPQGARVGTSSLRRRALLLSARADLSIVPIRGNVATRLKKIGTEVEAVVVAAAAVARLEELHQLEGLETASFVEIPPEIMLPAPGQGLLALEIRPDLQIQNALAGLEDFSASLAFSAERAFMVHLGAGCHIPAAAWARLEDGSLVINALAASADGKKVLKTPLMKTDLSSDTAVSRQKAAELGHLAAEKLLQSGAAQLFSGADL